jgi:hypothetical protein
MRSAEAFGSRGSAATSASFSTFEPWLPPNASSESGARCSFLGKPAKPPRTGFPVTTPLLP